MPKPRNGFWACPEDSEHSWLDFAESAGWIQPDTDIMFFSISQESRVCIINTKTDLDEIIDKYPLSPSLAITGLTEKYIDYEALSKDYDVFWLTAHGEISTRFSTPNSLYGFDCETVLILNPDIVINI